MPRRVLLWTVAFSMIVPWTAAQGPQDRRDRRDRPSEMETQDEPPAMTLSDPVPVSRTGTATRPSADPSSGQAAVRPRRRTEPPPAIRAIRTGGLRAEVAALIMSGQSGGPLPIEVLSLPLRTEGEKARLPLTVEVAWDPLLAGHAEDPLKLEIFAYALTPSGGLRGSMMQSFEIDTERLTDDQRGRGGLKFSGELQIEPGTYSLRVLARNPISGDLGLRLMDLDVPTEQAWLSPMLVDSDSAGWQALRQAYDQGRSPGPVTFLDTLPEAKPVLTSRERIPFRILASRLDAVPSELVIETVDYDGQLLSELAAEIEHLSEPTQHGVRQITGHFQADLSPGEHRLRVRLQGDMGESIRSPVLPALVSSAVDGGISWATLQPAGLTTTASSEQRRGSDRQASDSKTPRRNIKTDAMVAGYRKVLDHLASGEVRKASRALYELEDAELQRGFDILEALRSVEIETAVKIAGADPEALAPLLLLHHGQYRKMRQRRLPLLSTHSRTVTLQLIELFLQRSKTPESQKLAVSLMASLGSEARQAGMIRLSENMLRRVLNLDASNETALLYLGASAERTSEYSMAVEYFEQLVEAYPHHGQARLRLAVNLLREGRKRVARRHLENLVEGQHRNWILSLGYQELARLMLRDNDLDGAITLLRQGIERVPVDEKLYMQLAFALDADQQDEEMVKVLQAMELRARTHQESTRHRYTQWPVEALRATQERIESQLQRNSDRLGKVLASWDAKGGSK